MNHVIQGKFLQNRVYFRTKGVVLLVPTLATPVLVLSLPIPQLAAMPSVDGGFQPIDPVINLKVITATPPHTFVTNLPITLHIRYTLSHVNQAKQVGKPLRLGYWDGSTWQYFTKQNHGFYLRTAQTNMYAGWGIARLNNWRDPIPTWGT